MPGESPSSSAAVSTTPISAGSCSWTFPTAPFGRISFIVLMLVPSRYHAEIQSTGKSTLCTTWRKVRDKVAELNPRPSRTKTGGKTQSSLRRLLELQAFLPSQRLSRNAHVTQEMFSVREFATAARLCLRKRPCGSRFQTGRTHCTTDVTRAGTGRTLD